MRGAAAISTALQAPTGGWDTREALADMPIENAIIMDNWFPGTSKVQLRRGHAEHATGMSGNVDSLLEYTALTGTGKLFAASGSAIYDVSSAGSASSVSTGYSSAQWQHLQIGTAGGQFLFAVNGADAPVTYDGSSWANPSITGPTVANLVWCNLHQRRLWFGEKDSLTAWYLGINAISGAASSFSLAGIARLGGYIMAMGTWTRDAGDGQDDVAVFLTSEGEAIVYAGTDPSSASTWALIGVFRIGKPIGRRCVMKAGADLIMVTQDGFVAGSSILSIDRSQSDKVALSSQIARAVNDAVREGKALYGWQPILYPRGTQLLVNVPISTTEYHQYVFNTLTGAPCRFKGMNARSWGLLNDNLYFGGADGKVYLADSGVSDNGANIQGDVLQAFSYFRSPGRNKAFKKVEPIFESSGDPNAAIDLCLDFQIRTPTGVAAASPSTAARWGISKWGIGLWGSADQVFRGWRGVRGVGRSAALRIRVDSRTSRPAWVATNFLYVPGGLM